ncbi:MAG TPA: ankyrin repeat domain-containing protein [Gemmatimonadaceae bacterium]|jgi:ankyrin repeat protein|nr:ankyrin repeat domain-containing protein [Gemmatimonadaceae bacterium]
MPGPRPLPDSPDLDQLRRQAKELLRSARAADHTALSRFRVLPSLRQASDDDLACAALALHDAQSVIAREHGFTSWNALRERVEALTLDFDDAVREFTEAATDGRTSRAERMLALHPGIAGASLHTALLLGDAALVEAHLARQPALACAPGGQRGWEPIHYVCHTALGNSSAASADGLVAIARRLLELGADANTRFPWLHHGVRRPVLWGAIHATRLHALAELLLRAGADPNDGVTLPIAASAGDVASLELLRSFGASANQRWASDGSSALYAILQWARTPAGVRWLLEHDADADEIFAANGETPLHVVARRWDVEIAELLAQRGASLLRRRADGRTPYAVAELNANRAVADWLRAHGAADELEPVDQLVAACGRGDRVEAEGMLSAHPTLRDEITDAHYAVLHRAAEEGDSAMLALLIDCGFDPNRGDEEIGKTALHSAAMAGHPDAVRLLLARGASPDIRDREFNGQPLVWAAEGSRSPRDRAENYAEVGRLLLEAGTPVEWQQPGGEPAEGIVEIIAEWQRGGRALPV